MKRIGKYIVLPFCISVILFITATTHPRARINPLAATATLQRWPYLQQVTSDSARVLWTTNFKGSPSLEYGIGSEGQWLSVVSHVVDNGDSDYYQHEAIITGLKPKTWYFYNIYDNGVNLTPNEKSWFQTATTSGEFTFAAWGDSGLCTVEQFEIRDRLRERWYDTQLWIHTGDIAYPNGSNDEFGPNGSYDEFEQCHFDVYQELLSWRPFFPAIGNHEYNTDAGAPFVDIFDLPITPDWDWYLDEVERYYSFDWGDAHFVMLDSHTPLERVNDAVTNDMADWLAHDLANDDHTWKIAVIHRPVYSSSKAHPELDVREKMAPLFEAYGVDLVLSGHNHNYERTYPIRDEAISTLRDGGVVYVVTGGGGNQLYGFDGEQWFTAARAVKHHFVTVRVGKCALYLTAIDKDGNPIDQATLDKCPHQIYLPFVPGG